MTARPADQVADHVSLKPIHLKYRPDIDGLRAFAVLIVLFFHAFENELPGGFVGVDVFFVISGFLISTIIFKNLERESFSFVDFYIRRIKRILPVLILVLATCYAYGWFKMYPAEFMALGKHMAAGSIFGSNFALWQEAGYFDAESSSKPLLHLWSLAIEEQFYLLWPVLALLIFKLKLRFLPVNLLIVAGSFAIGIYLINIDQTAAFYSPASRFWEIGLGSLIAWITFKHGARYDLLAERFRLQHILSVFGTALLLFSLFYFDQTLRFPGYWAVLPTLGAAMVILAGPEALINKSVLARKPVVWVGLISYPIYLWHWPLLTAVHLEHTPFVVEHLTAIKWGVVAGSVALGWLSFTLVEKPLKNIRFEKPLAASIFVTFLGLGILGLYTNQNDGIATRIPENVRELASITNVYTYFDFSAAIRQDTCHFTTKMPDSFTRPAECFDTKRPLIMLWGDSYAAALYPGLRELSQSRNIGIEQVTVGNAPPFFDSNKLGADAKTLSDENSYALAVASQSKPNVIVISWMVSGVNAIPDLKKSVAAFTETVSKIRAASPESKIVLIGPVPHWDNTLSQTIVNYLKTQPMGAKMESYSTFGLVTGIKLWDDYFAAEIPKLGVTYISAYQAMCNERGCLTRVGPKNSDLTAVDWGHLTKAGSEYLIGKIGSEILAGTGLLSGNSSAHQ